MFQIWLTSLLAVNVGPEVLEFVRGVVGDHGGLAWLPSSGADFTVLVSESACLDQTQDLVSTSADGQVVHAVVTQVAFSVDEVGGTESSVVLAAAVFDQAAIVAGDASVDVGEEGNVHLANAASGAVEHGPALVDEDGVA